MSNVAAISSVEAQQPVPPAQPGDWHDCPPDPLCPYCHPEKRGHTSMAEPLDWSFIDAVYCISLNTRDDRAERVAEQFHRTGLCQRVRYYRPGKHPKKGIIGSWESHRAVAMDAESRGCRTALVFEDDVLFVRPVSAKRLERLGRRLSELPEDWHVLHLGHWPLRAWFVKPDLLRTISACAHAYVLSPRGMAWLRKHPYGSPGIEMTPRIGRALDSAFSRLPGVYAVFPMLATQSVSKSDNFNYKPKPKTKAKHWVTRSRYREFMLSHLMRPFELGVVLLSPYFWLYKKITGRDGGKVRVTEDKRHTARVDG